RAVVADQLAGLVGRRMPFTRRLDQLAFLLGVVAQRNEGVHAGLRRTAAGLSRRRRRERGRITCDRRGTTGGERRHWCPDGRNRRPAVDRGKGRIVGTRPAVDRREGWIVGLRRVGRLQIGRAHV